MKAIFAIMTIVLCVGCKTLTCNDKANWAVTEFERKGLTPAGIYVVRFKGIHRICHSVTWYTEDGKEWIWDQAFHCPRKLSHFAHVIKKQTGQLHNWPESVLPTLEQIKNYPVGKETTELGKGE